MAGGKETPRQKLISLMYLVLLALLALQVSSVIIEKFEFLNTGLEGANTNAERQSNDFMRRIEVAVKNNKFAPKDVAIQDQAKALRKQTNDLVLYIQKVKEQLITQTGGRDENGKLVGAKEEEAVAIYMLGPGESKSGEGYKVKNQLNTYISSLNNLMAKMKFNKKFKDIALDGKDDPFFKNNIDHKNKSFAQLNFEGTPLVAALAMLSEKEAEIRSMEMEALSLLAGKVGGDIIPVDKIRPVVQTQSSYVVAGLDYEAQMFMAAYSSNYKPKMNFNGSTVSVDGQGAGKIKFRASGGAFDDKGLMKKIWTGTITYPKAGGGDTTYTVKQEYYVVKPVIEVKAASVQTLYRDCGNKLDIGVPQLELANQYQPSFNVTGGELRKGTTAKLVTIVPTSHSLNVKVMNQGMFIGELNYKTKALPAPVITLKAKGNQINQIKGVDPSDLRQLKIEIKADNEVATLLPDDTKYQLAQCKIILARKKSVIKNLTYTNGSSWQNLIDQVSREAQSGDRIIIEIEKVTRKNFLGKIIPVDNINNRVFSVPVVF